MHRTLGFTPNNFPGENKGHYLQCLVFIVQLDWIWDHLGDTLWGVTMGERGRAVKTHPECGQPYPMGWGSGLGKPAEHQPLNALCPVTAVTV